MGMRYSYLVYAALTASSPWAAVTPGRAATNRSARRRGRHRVGFIECSRGRWCRATPHCDGAAAPPQPAACKPVAAVAASCQLVGWRQTKTRKLAACGYETVGRGLD